MNRKMMNLGIGLCFACVATLLAASCTDDTDDGTTLPDGKYPMTFTASVDGLTATRATTDTDGKTSWENSDPVAISMDGGANHKQYKISNTGTGAMSPDGDANILYWSKTQETLAAWYPIGCTIGSGGGGSEVSITDQHSGFGTLENILHAPAKDYTYSSSNPVAFTFRHALAKVKVTLQKGDGMENSDLSGATVTFMGYTAGTLGYDGMTGSGNNGAITPKTVTSTTNGSSITTYTALLIPQQMQGKQFIKVTVGTSSAARDYYYTPTNSTDADLEAGKEYAYTITVKKTGLAVQVTDNGAAWGSGTDITGGTPSTIENHVITITNKSSLTNLEVKDANGTVITAQLDGTYLLPATATTFSVSYDAPSDKKQSLVPTSGLCRLNRTLDSGTQSSGSPKHICNYSSVISDVTLALGEYMQMGDFYYSDGTWSAPFTVSVDAAANSTSPTIIGIVLKVGKDDFGDWKDDCTYQTKGGSTMTTIRGYVLALENANNGSDCVWGSKGTSVVYEENGVDMMNRERNTGFYGYKNTQAIISFNEGKSGTLSSAFPATYYATTGYEASYPAPANSSGWFLPSAGQCKYWLNNQGTLLESVQKATGNSSYNWNDWYWSSSEHSSNPGSGAWYVNFSDSIVDGGTKSGQVPVRSCLAF